MRDQKSDKMSNLRQQMFNCNKLVASAGTEMADSRGFVYGTVVMFH